MGGTCWMRPTNGASAASSAGASSAGTGRVSSTAPVRSCVSVVTPRRTVATYSLSRSTRYGVSLVASPIRMGSTPVAAGSSVPPCPMRGARSTRRRWATTWNEVTPGPFSTGRMPAR